MIRSRPRVAALAAAAAALALPLGGVLATGSAAPVTHTVQLTGFVFKPDTLRARPGDKVRFVWKDGVHNVVSMVVGPSQINARKVTDHRPPLVATLRKGTYRLICQPHELAGMVITIRVR